MYKQSHLKLLDDYSEHAGKVRDIVCNKLDSCLNKKELDIEELRRLILVFRNYKYMDAETFLAKKGSQ